MAGITHVSASSIELFKNCERKWYHRYINGHKGETSDAMLRGTRVHEALEKYLEKGTAPDLTTPEGQIASTGLHHLPAPSTENTVEVSLERLPLREPLEVPFKGFIDLLHEDEDGTPLIIDHKTTSGTRYMKTPEELSVNTQMIVYAKHVLDNSPEHDAVILRHIYYVTRKPYKSQVREVRVTRDHVEEQFALIAEIVSKMVKASQQPQHVTVLNPSFCKAYNRQCDHYNDCFFTLERRENRPMSEKQKKTLAFLRGETDNTAKSEEKEATAIGSEKSTAVGSGVHIYVGVVRYGGEGEMRMLSEALDDHISTICIKHSTKSIYTIKYKAGFDELAEAILQWGIPEGHWYIDPSSEYWTRLSDVIFTKADTVYTRG